MTLRRYTIQMAKDDPFTLERVPEPDGAFVLYAEAVAEIEARVARERAAIVAWLNSLDSGADGLRGEDWDWYPTVVGEDIERGEHHKDAP